MFNLLLDIICTLCVRLVQHVYEGLFRNGGEAVYAILGVLTDPAGFPKGGKYFQNIVALMDIFGWVMIVVVSYGSIAKIVISPYQETKAQHPFKAMLKIVFAVVLLANRNNVLNAVSELFHLIFDLLDLKNAFGVAGWNFIGVDIVPSWLFTRLVILCTLCYTLITAALAYLERIVTFAIFAYTYPIAIAFIAGDQTNESAKLWLKGIISQMILIVISSVAIVAGLALSNSFFSASEVGAIDMVSVFIGINFLGLVKNAEKFLNIYNIRTMPNQDSVRAFTAGFGQAMGAAAMGMKTAASAIGTVSDVKDMFSRAGDPLQKPVNPFSAGAAALKTGGMSGGTSAGRDNKTVSVSKQSGQAYASSLNAQSNGTASTAERLTQQKIIEPTSSEMLTAARNAGINVTGRQAGARTIPGSMTNFFGNVSRQSDFNAGVKETVARRNEAIDKVNAGISYHTGVPLKQRNPVSLDDRWNQVFKYNHDRAAAENPGTAFTANEEFTDRNDFSDSAKEAYLKQNDPGYWTWKGQVPEREPEITNKDVASAYGLADRIPNFTPSDGLAVWVTGENGAQNGMHGGYMISGTEYDPRTGKTAGKSYVIGDEFTQHEANGRMGDGQYGNYNSVDVSDRNVRQVNDQIYAYEASPHRYTDKEFEGSRGSRAMQDEYIETQNALFRKNGAFGYGDSGNEILDTSMIQIPGENTIPVSGGNEPAGSGMHNITDSHEIAAANSGVYAIQEEKPQMSETAAEHSEKHRSNDREDIISSAPSRDKKEVEEQLDRIKTPEDEQDASFSLPDEEEEEGKRGDI